MFYICKVGPAGITSNPRLICRQWPLQAVSFYTEDFKYSVLSAIGLLKRRVNLSKLFTILLCAEFVLVPERRGAARECGVLLRWSGPAPWPAPRPCPPLPPSPRPHPPGCPAGSSRCRHPRNVRCRCKPQNSLAHKRKAKPTTHQKNLCSINHYESGTLLLVYCWSTRGVNWRFADVAAWWSWCWSGAASPPCTGASPASPPSSRLSCRKQLLGFWFPISRRESDLRVGREAGSGCLVGQLDGAVICSASWRPSWRAACRSWSRIPPAGTAVRNSDERLGWVTVRWQREKVDPVTARLVCNATLSPVPDNFQVY